MKAIQPAKALLIAAVIGLGLSGGFAAAALLPGKGLRQLYDEGRRGPQYSVLVNLVASF